MQKKEFTPEQHHRRDFDFKSSSELVLIQARRTAFVARFIVLRESKRSKAHREIEMLKWKAETTAEDLANIIMQIFQKHKDSSPSIKRDIKRALEHASRSIEHFIEEYYKRATLNFIDALEDYDRSNSLLFDKDDQPPKMSGWQLTSSLRKL